TSTTMDQDGLAFAQTCDADQIGPGGACDFGQGPCDNEIHSCWKPHYLTDWDGDKFCVSAAGEQGADLVPKLELSDSGREVRVSARNIKFVRTKINNSSRTFESH